MHAYMLGGGDKYLYIISIWAGDIWLCKLHNHFGYLPERNAGYKLSILLYIFTHIDCAFYSETEGSLTPLDSRSLLSLDPAVSPGTWQRPFASFLPLLLQPISHSAREAWIQKGWGCMSPNADSLLGKGFPCVLEEIRTYEQGAVAFTI